MERHCALIAAVLLSSAAAVSCGGRFPLGSDDSGKCTLNCEAGAAVEGMWDSVWSLDYIPVEIKRNLETLGWTSRGWDECGACYKNNWGKDPMDCVVNEYWGDGKNPACPLTEVLDWRYLTASQKEAATALGYSHESWDATSPYSCCYDSPIDELKIVVPDKEGKPIIISLP